MKKIVLGITYLVLCGALISCDMSGKGACEKCCNSVQKSLGKDAPQSMDEAIALYNWEVAHKYVGCYDNLTEETDRTAAKEKLLRAEASYLLNQGESNMAENVAKELGMMVHYQKILAEELPGLIKNNRYKEAVDILTTWVFSEDFREAGEPFDISEPRNREKDNESYNSEISSFNDLVDILLNRAIIERNVDLAKKCLVLYVPNAVYRATEKVDPQHKYYKYVLKNTYKEAAQKKLREAGMKM